MRKRKRRPVAEAAEPSSYDRKFYARVLLASFIVIMLVVGFVVYRVVFYKASPGSGPDFDLSSLYLGENGIPDPENPCIVLQEYLEAIRKEQFESAYDSLCSGLRQTLSIDEFAGDARSNPLLFSDVSGYRCSNFEESDGSAEADGYIVYEGGGRSRVKAAFAFENGRWKIALATVIYE